MNWYETLKEYFPEEELKTKQHLDTLLAEKDYYYLDCSEQHVLLYAEFPNFIFVDYMYVRGTKRHRGIGKQLIHKLKKKGKTIILEAEPQDPNDPDTSKRLRFYSREAFHKADCIQYTKHSLITGEKVNLDILYWDSSGEENEVSIYMKMIQMYEEVHTFKEFELYNDFHPKAHDAIHFAKTGRDLLS
ncbi:GNAT family N-acetyltransferase [Alkalibacillus haloalkaliphilus]|uniref:GNAT family N-acetyltransferase n=1 Tax=Alkalibacillus haloalkaliphilus TaxID=94136 RepID=UPI002935ED57|nr:GNAT family N-acetyltransferase [Alkalibacillus haloalkaliphilus]MDV2582149.1 GNAT family N-acetyltransferase [Alkalibacillus haloalkaliphilus]